MIKKISNKISKHPYTTKGIAFYKALHITRYKISFSGLLKHLIVQVQKDDLVSKANDMAFNFLLSVFPAIIFLFTLIPYVPIPDMTQQVMHFMSQVMPYALFKTVESTIYDIIATPRGGLLSFGFVMTFYSAMNGMNTMMEAFNKCYHTPEKRSFLKKRLYAFILMIVLTFVLILSVIVILVGEYALDYVVNTGVLHDSITLMMINITRYGTVAFTLYISIALIYKLGPSAGRRWHFFSYGTGLATILIVGASAGFSFYLSNFATYNKLYGSIGTLIALMLWLMIISFVILLGFELNACVDALKPKEEKKLVTAEPVKPELKNI